MLFYFNLIYFLLLFNYSCPHFPPLTLPGPTHLPPPTFNPHCHPHPYVHVVLCPCVLYACSLMTFPFFTYYPPPPSPLVSQFVLNFNVFGYALLAFLFC